MSFNSAQVFVYGAFGLYNRFKKPEMAHSFIH
jgi:hypothetical protein